MIRVLLTVLLPLAAPFLIYLGWIWLARRKASSGVLIVDWRETPWPWMLLIGICWAVAGLFYLHLSQGYPAGTKLEPPALVDGVVVPSHPVE
jgi:hypothetical protein